MSDPDKIQIKKWYKSKTLWINGLGFIAGLATMMSGSLEAGTPITIAAVVNFALRFYTSHQVE